MPDTRTPVRPDFRGDFEIHLTVAPQQGPALAAWAAGRGLKVVDIELARGAVPRQPMLTLTVSGTLAEAEELAARTGAEAGAAGFPVLRTKIEAAPWTAGVPATDGRARALGPAYYFEHHVKLLLDAPPGPELAAAAERHDAHLSRNARRTRPDGRTEFFVTQRCRLVGADTAGRRLDALLAALAGHRITSVEREFAVLDTAEALDAGWIAEARPAEAQPSPDTGERTAR
ncbi:hypothetical protein [Kitasatospora sp. DSM 101779]|uniref:hypothetical protein n=1 Tax=Kitasatospora sp. DSM 101779 TaxID=2853165 RepID=UPI0021D9D282|nr:hypothetical protein [Kitasatospora sp. DSM 101779]MCU7823100.1 hypothetical protein [Kitasatospora sp. DSM 101779]